MDACHQKRYWGGYPAARAQLKTAFTRPTRLVPHLQSRGQRSTIVHDLGWPSTFQHRWSRWHHPILRSSLTVQLAVPEIDCGQLRLNSLLWGWLKLATHWNTVIFSAEEAHQKRQPTAVIGSLVHYLQQLFEQNSCGLLF